jgi:uncharacterized protein (TIGR02246 family)
VALAFVDRINDGDVAGIAALLTEDHEFVDTAGESFRGRETLRQGWIGYFQLFPDYRIAVEHVHVDGDRVALLAVTSGTLSAEGAETLRRPDGTLPAADELQGPVILTAQVRDGQIAQWRVFWDTPEARAELGFPRPATGEPLR